MARLVLWDIDHTLIENAGVSKAIYAAAYRALTGREPSHLAPTEGRTDPDIMAEMLAMHGDKPAQWPAVEAALMTAGKEHRELLAEQGHVLPGVVATVGALAACTDVVQSVVTGNIRANADVKLGALGLDRMVELDVGGYGSDGSDRAGLVLLAMQRAAARHGVAFSDAAAVVVIGDTPRDIEAAQRAGVRVLAVASGIHTADELRDAGATAVLPALTNPQLVLSFVLG